ncbi:MAG: alpha/beta fold hydrolase [Paracoccaceae bacterium]
MIDQFCTLPSGRRLCYRVYGDGVPLVLVAGITLQLHSWPKPFLDALAEKGFQPIVFDNRDVGQSGRVDQAPPTLWQLALRNIPQGSYTLDDMAQDTFGLMDHLGLDHAHIVGMSMGGMIAQTMAIENANRVTTLTSIFSSTGATNVGQPTAQMKLRLSLPMPKTLDGAVKRFLSNLKYWQGRGYAANPKHWEGYVREASRRSSGDPRGALLRQAAAIIGSGDRTAALEAVTAPTLVIHGDRDPVVAPSGGKATAAAIPNARLEIIQGMGHDLADGLAEKLSDLVSSHAAYFAR